MATLIWENYHVARTEQEVLFAVGEIVLPGHTEFTDAVLARLEGLDLCNPARLAAHQQHSSW